MKRGPTGRYEISTVVGEPVRAFTPNPLPPTPPLEMTEQRQKLSERATLALRRLDSITLLLPNPEAQLELQFAESVRLEAQIRGSLRWLKGQ